MTTRRALRQSGTETTAARAMRLAREDVGVARSLVPQDELGHDDLTLELFYVAGYEQACRDLVTVDDNEAERSTGARRPLLSRSETQ